MSRFERGTTKARHTRESRYPEFGASGFLLEFIPMKIGAGMTDK
jgi:hypothetical protein